MIGSKKLAGIWGICVIILCCYCLLKISSGVRLDTSILSLLPSDQKDPVAEEVIHRVSSKISKKQILLFQHKEFTKNIKAVNIFCKSLKDADKNNVLAKVACKIDPQQIESAKQFFFRHRFHLMADSFAEKIKDQKQLINTTMKAVYAPFTPRIGSLLDDPFNHSMESLQEIGSNTKTYIKDGFVVAKNGDREWIIIFVETRDDPFSMATQKQVSGLIANASAKAKTDIGSMGSELQIVKSGLIFHALHGAKTAKGEMSTIGIGSIVLIGLALLFAFRSPIKIICAFVPTAIGCLFAFSLSLMVFERINLITMVFGASLVGVSIDYALHFLCELNSNQSDSGKKSIENIFSGLVLGLISSCIAYGALALAPFPGIRQMSLFAVAGLVGSWLTVVCWFSMLKPVGKKGVNFENRAVSNVIYSISLKANNSNARVFLIAIFITVVMAIVGSGFLKANDSIAVLNNPSNELKQSEQLIRSLIDPPSSTQFIIVSAEDEQALLQKEEQVAAQLKQMVIAGKISGFNAVSNIVPSIAAQKKNYRLYGDRIYSLDGALKTLFVKLGIPEQQIDTVLQMYQSDKNNFLNISEWLNSSTADAFGYQWIGKTEFGYLSVITINGASSVLLRKAFADKYEGVRFIDKVADISGVLSKYRQIITIMLIAAYMAVFLLLAIRYKGKAFYIILAPLLSTIITVSILSIIGVELNIFCILALLLVLGIGLDYGIFLKESRCSKESVFAVALSCYTTICSFGFLSMSSTPVLRFFGLTLLIGILLVWLLTFILYRYQIPKDKVAR